MSVEISGIYVCVCVYIYNNYVHISYIDMGFLRIPKKVQRNNILLRYCIREISGINNAFSLRYQISKTRGQSVSSN